MARCRGSTAHLWHTTATPRLGSPALGCLGPISQVTMTLHDMVENNPLAVSYLLLDLDLSATVVSQRTVLEQSQLVTLHLAC